MSYYATNPYTVDPNQGGPPFPPPQHPSGNPQEVRTVRVLARGNACFSCRRRKQRCDGTRPVCNQCTRFNRVGECIFEERHRTQTEILEDRVRELEALVAQATRDAEANGFGTPGPSTLPSSGVIYSPITIPRDGELPRPDFALVPAQQGTWPPFEVPREVIQALYALFLALSCRLHLKLLDR